MIKIAFTGDIMLSRRVAEKLNTTNQLISSEVKSVLDSVDCVVGNLECPITKISKPLKKEGFKADISSLDEIDSFDVLSLANNHIFDCGKEGAIETLESIESKGFLFSGLVTKKKEDLLAIEEIKGKKIGFISAATSECIKNEDANCPNIINADSDDFLSIISKNSSMVDFLFVLLHGGNEMVKYPDPTFRELCKKIIKKGATSIISHHPHVLGGMEYYNSKPIFYSLGDFIFDGQSYKRRRGGILTLEIKNESINYKLNPTCIDKNLHVRIPSKKEIGRVIKSWERVSKSLTEKEYTKRYKKRYIISLLNFQFDRVFFLLRNKGVIYTVNFVLKKINLFKFYFKQISSKKI